MVKALNKKGFSFIEVLAPCPTLYLRRNKLGSSVDLMKYFKEKSVIKHGADTKEVGLETFDKEIIVGEFVDIDGKPDYLDNYNEILKKKLGDKFQPWGR